MTSAKPDLQNLGAAIAACESEPIQIPGAILPHGALVVCDPVSLTVRHVSRNYAGITKQGAGAFPLIPERGTALADLIGPGLLHDLRNAAARAGGRLQAGVMTGVPLPGAPGLFDLAMHSHGGAILVEIEPVADGGQGAAQALETTRQLAGRLAAAATSERLYATGARLVQALLGFDRVMVYRFLHDGSGRVVAEARQPGMDSFLGHHFPPGDIPPQARALYLANPIRVIPDAGYEPVPLDPPLAPGEAPVDLSHAQLRSVSPVHCAYLRNMGVGASMSISIIAEGRLWGLVACHHPVPRQVPLALRVSAELLGHFLSLQIAGTERREARSARAETRAQIERLMADVGQGGPLVAALAPRLPALAATLGCHAATLLQGPEAAATPGAPPEAAGRALLEAARRAGAGPVWAVQEMPPGLVAGAGEGAMAGAMVIQPAEGADCALILYRRSEAHDIDWAGPPAKQLTQIAGRAAIAPRQSFALWRERVLGRAIPWSEHDHGNADTLLSWLRERMLHQSEAVARAGEAAARHQHLVQEELNHRIKNVLALVRSIALQTGSGAASVADYSAALEGRLQALAAAHDRSLSAAGGTLAGLVEAEAVLHRSAGSPERVAVEGPALWLDDKAYGVMALVLHEMMTNAVKYGALSVPEGRLDIGWTLAPEGNLVLDWAESGGPPVAPPRRQGFGSRLIRSALEQDLRGLAEIDYAPEGLVARLILPAGHMRPGAEEPPSGAPLPVAAATLDGQSVLVVEDQALIAMDIEATLRHLGAREIRLAGSAAAAMQALQGFRPDLAVLDVNLGGDTSAEVAEALAGQGVPFLFMTGYSDRIMLPPRMGHVPLVRKPVSAAAIAANVAQARAAAGGGAAVAAAGDRAEEGARPAP